jgi:hypothetical protein
MPIEIKELHIRVTVNSEPSEPASGAAFGGAKTEAAETDKAALVAECVEQVLQILQNKQER